MIAAPILEDIGPLLAELAALGVRVTDSRYNSDCFGDYLVDLTGPRGGLRLIRDRGQLLIDGEIDRIKSLGLLRAFDSREAFRDAALSYARTIV
jgi:hypothetical protein